MPLLDIDYIIYKDVIARKGIYLHQLATGIILSDKNDTLKKIKNKCTSIYNIGPHKLSEEEIHQLRGKITTRIEDLKGNSNPDDTYYIAIELYQFIIDAYLKVNQKWLFTGKSAGRFLRKEAPDFHYLLKLSYTKIIYNDTSSLIDLANYVLKPLGGELHFTSTSVCSSLVIGDYLTIFVPIIYSQSNVHLTNALCIQFIKTMNKLAPQFSWIRLNWFYGQSNQPCVFLICHSSNNILNHELLPIVDMFIKSLDNTSLALHANCMEYPYVLSPLNSIKSENTQLLVFNFINYLQNKQSNLISSQTFFSLIKRVWLKLNTESSEYAIEIWDYLISMFSQNENLQKLILNKSLKLNNEASIEPNSNSKYNLPSELLKYFDDIISECLNSSFSSLLMKPEGQIQSLFKILQYLDAISDNINIYEILKEVRNNHD